MVFFFTNHKRKITTINFRNKILAMFLNIVTFYSNHKLKTFFFKILLARLSDVFHIADHNVLPFRSWSQPFPCHVYSGKKQWNWGGESVCLLRRDDEYVPRRECRNLDKNKIRAESIYHNIRCVQGKAGQDTTCQCL